MKTNSWDEWLRGWVRRHPVGEPPQELQREYSRQVMARIRAENAPKTVLQPIWVLRPRPVFVFAGALAAALAVLLVIRAPARVDHQEAALLNYDGDLEQELQEQDRIVLAEAVEPSKTTSAEQETLELWEETENSSDDDLVNDLRQADESELAFS